MWLLERCLQAHITNSKIGYHIDIVIRFARDLSTPDTMKKHSDIIEYI